MGSNFNLGSIPEDMSMDTDLDTTLTAETNNGAGSAPNNFIIGQTQIGNVNNANTNGNIQAATNKMDANELISTVLPGHGEIGLGNDDIENMIARRADAKSNKNFELADQIREELLDNGIILEDTINNIHTIPVKYGIEISNTISFIALVISAILLIENPNFENRMVINSLVELQNIGTMALLYNNTFLKDFL